MDSPSPAGDFVLSVDGVSRQAPKRFGDDADHHEAGYRLFVRGEAL